MNSTILTIQNLHVAFQSDKQEIYAVNGANLSIGLGEIVALVGESGCGKSATAASILRLIEPQGRIVKGKIQFHYGEGHSVDIASLDTKDPLLYDLRGGKIGMIFQEPMSALSPVHSIGNQMCEAIRLHTSLSKKDALAKAEYLLSRVGIANASRVIHQYAHELSGGMRQRVIIAMAISCNPRLIIADEPTTALDVTLQAQMLSLIRSIALEQAASILLITHDLGVVAQVADYVSVMYLGRIVESGSVRSILRSPVHPYTKGLIISRPDIKGNTGRRLPAIHGMVPPLHDIPQGCPFHPRCEYAIDGKCNVGPAPELVRREDGRLTACLRAGEID